MKLKDHPKIITFDKSSLRYLCRAFKVPYDKNIIAFTKKGVIKNILDLIREDL